MTMILEKDTTVEITAEGKQALASSPDSTFYQFHIVKARIGFSDLGRPQVVSAELFDSFGEFDAAEKALEHYRQNEQVIAGPETGVIFVIVGSKALKALGLVS
jgi:hypothetical protein